MKASEVLQLYQAGERNFKHVNLRGQFFRKANLADADFSYADIRGANFTEANLTGVKFTKAKAGLQKRWAIGLLIFALLLIALSAYFTAYAAVVVTKIFDPSTEDIIRGGVVFVIIIGLCYSFLLSQGIRYTGSVVAGLLFSIVFSIALGLVLGLVLTVAFSIVFYLAFSIVFYLAFSIVFYLAPVTNSLLTATETSIAIAFSLVTLGLNIYLLYRAYQGDERDVWVRGIGIAVAATGGTNFFAANLTEADFSQAVLKNTNFGKAILTRTCFHQAKKLDFARVGNTILTATPVRKLLVNGNGAKQDYTRANLWGANLDNANLEGAILKYANLSKASLVGANLQSANLTEAQAVGTNFTQARLTGACIEACNVDHTTILEEVDCLWVYLAEQEQKNSNQWGERRPSSGEFAPGDFTKLFTEIVDTVDLIFHNGVDWKAFVTAFKEVEADNNVTIRSVENIRDGAIRVKLNVPPGADKEKIHSTFNQNYYQALEGVKKEYEAKLAGKDREIAIYQETSSNMHHITSLLASKQPNFHINNKVMNNSEDNSQNLTIGDNFRASNFVANLRDVSGNVSNTIQQLPETTSDAPGIKELLTQLQTAIDDETELSDKDKAKALKQVQKLAAAGENPQANQDDADDSLTMLKGIVSGLKETAKLVTTCKEIIPLLTGLFGLV